MYPERSYGYKYNEVHGGEIRADVKQAVAEGLLPKRWKYSVTKQDYSGGRSIDVEVRDCADAWVEEDLSRCPLDGLTGQKTCQENFHYSPRCAGALHLTEEADAALMTLKRIHGAYNYDGSDSMTDYFDVNYYGIVKFEDAWTAAWKAKEKARKEAKKQSRVI
jgi:hypothetical protein